jgi:isopenicillin N synthase-like dioxygenase
MEDLAARIMRVFAVALMLDEDFFAPTIDRPISALRALNYPEQAVPPKPGQLRAGAHTDYGSLTILLPEPGSGGLEILAPDGAWACRAPRAGRLRHQHRRPHGAVDQRPLGLDAAPRRQPGAEARRLDAPQSFAFFHQPNWHQEIACLPSCLADGERAKYEPVLSGPYLMGKFQSTVKAG